MSGQTGHTPRQVNITPVEALREILAFVEAEEPTTSMRWIAAYCRAALARAERGEPC